MLLNSSIVQLRQAASSGSAPRQCRVAASPPRLKTPCMLAKSFRAFIASFSKSSPTQQARNELLDLIAAGSAADSSQAAALVDVLLESRLPFDERLLGGGPWRVVWSCGPQLWQAYTVPGEFVGQKNRASQDLQPATRTVVNMGELLGSQLYVTAEGTYAPRDDASSLPKVVDVSVTQGALHTWGRVFPLPIRGKGTFTIAYLDRDMRLFRSGKNVTLQVREECLEQLQARAR